MTALDTSGTTLKGWDPEVPERWSASIARRTLIISTFSLFLGFAVWFLPNAIAPRLESIGFTLTKNQLYWLTAMPGLSCALLRLVYMFLPALIGTRKMVVATSILYVLPMTGWFFALRNPETPFSVLLALATACGIGGAAFSGYMPSTSFFYPKRLQGTVLGLQGGLGNLGMSAIQLGAPLLMGVPLFGLVWVAPEVAAQEVRVLNAVVFLIPWALLAAVLAFVMLKDVPIKANIKQQMDIFSNPNTWYMTVLYIMTFGLFSGFGAQMGLIINANYGARAEWAQGLDAATLDSLPKGLSYAFLGTLIGALMRFAAGPLADRFGGAILTFISSIGMCITLTWCGIQLIGVTDDSKFWPYLIGMLCMFFFAGVGNASTFKQMPMIMPPRQAGGAVGFTAAVAALGPFLVGVTLTVLAAPTFYFIAAAYCVLCAVISWVRYARPGAPFPG